ncbi:MAG: M48 family metallopeptidase [Novosphingobium sp.]
MIEWLRRAPDAVPTVELGGRMVPVVLRRLPQARRMTLRLAPDGSEVRVSLPRWGRSAEALAFVRARQEWLESQLAKVPLAKPVGDGEAFPLHGEPLTIRHDRLAPRSPAIEQGQLIVGGPSESVTARVQRWLEGEARRVLTDDLGDYCARAGVPTPKLALSRAQRRWGSCARSGAIRLNWRLVMAPPFVRRSVAAHEVAHLLHFDHSQAFHAALAALYEGDIAAADRWLKREGRGLYRWFG